MMYLGNIPSKSDSKPSILLTELPFSPCEKASHSMYTLNMVCIEKECPKRGLICVMCNYESHRAHKSIPLKVFIDKYMASYKEFQENQGRNELNIDTIQGIRQESLNLLSLFQNKLIKEVKRLENVIKTTGMLENKAFLEEEEGSKDPLFRLLSKEETYGSKEAFKVILKLLERIIYKEKEEGEEFDIESLEFSHTNNETLVKRFNYMKEKALSSQNKLKEALEKEFSSLQAVFLDLEGLNQYKVAPPPIEFLLKEVQSFISPSKSPLCIINETLYKEHFDFLIIDQEDNNKLKFFNYQRESPLIIDLKIKTAIKHILYSNKLSLLIGLDIDNTLFTIKNLDTIPFLWISPNYNDLFSDRNMVIVGNRLIVGMKSFLYIMEITHEGAIIIQVKIEINGVVELISEGLGEKEAFFLWNQQNTLKRFISTLDFDKGLLKGQIEVGIDYNPKGFIYERNIKGFIFWGVDLKGNREFLEVFDGDIRKKLYLEENIRLFGGLQDEKGGLYIVYNNNKGVLMRIDRN